MFDDELAAADAYTSSFSLAGVDAMPTRHLAVLTCMDARIDPLRIFGLEPGEAVILRNAGARVDAAMRNALAVAHDRLGVDRLLVLGHTDCRGTDDASTTVREDVEAFDVEGIAAGGFVYDVATGSVTPA
ncbi:MAG TPA: carbonic anhydrase [Gaiellaceae bacterium]|nr:carbonic anhydrase [Gaiellaceae bacterium]